MHLWAPVEIRRHSWRMMRYPQNLGGSNGDTLLRVFPNGGMMLRSVDLAILGRKCVHAEIGWLMGRRKGDADISLDPVAARSNIHVSIERTSSKLL